ncbi:MAG: sulfatase-like hydrolase/transferase, partial [Rhodobacteraceae bacterium]|nr:sulfatase-like hydrolase/transferase [Paracoccaceae bacterium]
IAEQDNESTCITRPRMDFIEARSNEGGETPWLCHVSLFKPHWPYIVPAPYHDMYGPQDFLPVVRAQAERETDHPVLKGFLNSPASKAFSRDDVRDTVLRGYMGLVKQCDDQMGVLFDWLEETGRLQDTMIVVTSDHGDYLGDHWTGEKMFFHDTSIKVPLIVYDPSSEADATRGMVCDALVESIDLVPTFYQVAGGDPHDIDHIVEGYSLCPILHGETTQTPRDASFCEYDYSHAPLAERLGLHPDDARMFMVATREWKLIQFEGGFRPVLFDLVNDPQELNDLGQSPDHAEVIAQMQDRLFAWTRRQSQRVTRSNAEILAQRRSSGGLGVMIGVVDADDVSPEDSAKYRGHKVADHRALR